VVFLRYVVHQVQLILLLLRLERVVVLVERGRENSKLFLVGYSAERVPSKRSDPDWSGISGVELGIRLGVLGLTDVLGISDVSYVSDVLGISDVSGISTGSCRPYVMLDVRPDVSGIWVGSRLRELISLSRVTHWVGRHK